MTATPQGQSTERSETRRAAVETSERGPEHWRRNGASDLMLALIEAAPHPLDLRQSNELF